MNRSSLLLILFFVAATACTSVAQQPANIPVAEFQKGIQSTDIQILDCRTPAEYNSGHLKNALLADWTKKDEFISRTNALDKSKPVYAYCLSGGRSGQAAKYLTEKGYTVYNLEGGIAAWKREGKPLAEAVEVAPISMSSYQAMIPNNKTVLVDFGAEWCPPCKKMNPIIDSLAAQKPLNFSLVKIDGGDQTALSEQMKVAAFPTFIIYKNGKEVWRKTGVVTADELVLNLR